MRSPARPSHSGGASPPARLGASKAPFSIASGSVPTSRLVPIVIVMGRSVFSRSVKHGIPRTVVSSWTPPESVRTSFDPVTRERKST